MMATGQWVSTARLGMALKTLGCRVEFLGLRGHPANFTRAFEKTYVYHPLWPMAGVRRALREAKPDVVIPADELAVLHLAEIGHGDVIGGARVIAAAESRMELQRVAESEGVAVPEMMEVGRLEDLDGAIRRLGLPLVLKADATSGGQGVRVAATAQEAAKAWTALHRPPSLMRAIYRGVKWREWTHVRPWAKGMARGVTAQRFIAGKERTGMAVCREGTVLAWVCLEVVEHWKDRGPSSVVRVIEDRVMEEAMRKVARRLGVSGFCGFDFMVEEGGTPLLIEMNPRPTQLVHLALGPGRDLVAAYVREVLGRSEVGDRSKVKEGPGQGETVIAVFPQEVQRDAESEWLKPELGKAFHDVPWESAELVRRALGRVPRVITEDARWRKRGGDVCWGYRECMRCLEDIGWESTADWYTNDVFRKRRNSRMVKELRSA